MNTVKQMPITVESLLQRIDTIMRELQEMRRLILSQTIPSEADLVDQLCGAFAPQQQDEEYDPYMEWERFS
jgi:hypothetical protein